MDLRLLRPQFRQVIDLATGGAFSKVVAVAERHTWDVHVIAGIERDAKPPCRCALAVMLIDDDGDVRGLEEFEFDATNIVTTVVSAIAITDSAAALSTDVIRKIGVPLLTANHGGFDWRVG